MLIISERIGPIINKRYQPMSRGSSLEVATFIYALLKFEASKQSTLVAILSPQGTTMGPSRISMPSPRLLQVTGVERTRSRSKITTVGTNNVTPDYMVDVAIITYKKSNAVSACVNAKVLHPRWGIRRNNPSPASPVKRRNI